MARFGCRRLLSPTYFSVCAVDTGLALWSRELAWGTVLFHHARHQLGTGHGQAHSLGFFPFYLDNKCISGNKNINSLL